MDKWQGSFAQSQLEKFGWESGEGLGKNRDGRTKHISVSKKNDKKGVGVGQDQWEFAWWDHLYNKSASEVTVEKDDQEIKVVNKNKSKDVRRSATGIISTERPTGKTITETTTTTTTTTMSSMADAMNDHDEGVGSMVKDLHMNMAQRIASGALYGGFVKSSTPVYDPSAPNTPTESTSSGEEDDELKDYSIKMTDAELFAACEGRTARKGGRGLVEQKGKFARVMQEYLHKNDDDDDVDLSKKRKRDTDDDGKKKKKEKKAKKDKKEKKAKKDKKEKKDGDKVKKDKKEKKKAKKDKKDKKTLE